MSYIPASSSPAASYVPQASTNQVITNQYKRLSTAELQRANLIAPSKYDSTRPSTIQQEPRRQPVTYAPSNRRQSYNMGGYGQRVDSSVEENKNMNLYQNVDKDHYANRHIDRVGYMAAPIKVQYLPLPKEEKKEKRGEVDMYMKRLDNRYETYGTYEQPYKTDQTSNKSLCCVETLSCCADGCLKCCTTGCQIFCQGCIRCVIMCPCLLLAALLH